MSVILYCGVITTRTWTATTEICNLALLSRLNHVSNVKHRLGRARATAVVHHGLTIHAFELHSVSGIRSCEVPLWHLREFNCRSNAASRSHVAQQKWNSSLRQFVLWTIIVPTTYKICLKYEYTDVSKTEDDVGIGSSNSWALPNEIVHSVEA